MRADTGRGRRSDARASRHPHADAAVIPDLRGTHVLAVDDEDDALAMVRDILQAAGATVATAQSASRRAAVRWRGSPPTC